MSEYGSHFVALLKPKSVEDLQKLLSKNKDIPFLLESYGDNLLQFERTDKVATKIGNKKKRQKL